MLTRCILSNLDFETLEIQGVNWRSKAIIILPSCGMTNNFRVGNWKDVHRFFYYKIR